MCCADWLQEVAAVPLFDVVLVYMGNVCLGWAGLSLSQSQQPVVVPAVGWLVLPAWQVQQRRGQHTRTCNKQPAHLCIHTSANARTHSPPTHHQPPDACV